MPNITESDKNFINRIYLGLEDYASIGFSAPSWNPVYADEEKSKIRFFEFRNTEDQTVEAAEGSGVYLGAQFGAREAGIKSFGFAKSNSWVDVKEINDAAISKDVEELDKIIAKGFPLCKVNDGDIGYYKFAKLEALPDNYNVEGKINLIYLRKRFASLDTENKNIQKNIWNEVKKYCSLIKFNTLFSLNEEIEKMKHPFMLNIKSLGINMQVEVDSEKDEQEFVKGLDTKINEVVQAKLDTQKPIIENWDGVKDAFGETVTLDEVKQTKKDHDVIKKKMVDNIIQAGILAGFLKPEDTEEKEKSLMKKSAEDLVEKLDDYQTVAKEKFPNQLFFDAESVIKAAGSTGDQDDPNNEPEVEVDVPIGNY